VGGIDIGGIIANLDVSSGNLEKGLAGGRLALAALGAEARKLQEDFKRGGVDAAEFAQRLRLLETTARDVADRMQLAYRALGSAHNPLDIFNQGANQAAGGAKNLGMAMMQLGYIVDDIRYGFSAVVNNIGPLVLSLTGNAGVAAAAQVAGVAAYELATHWQSVQEYFGDDSAMRNAGRSLETLTEQIQKLKTAIAEPTLMSPSTWFNMPSGEDVANLERFEKQAKDFRRAEAAAGKLEKEETEAEKEDSERFGQAVVESGGAEKIARDRAAAEIEGHPENVPKHLTETQAQQYREQQAVIDAPEVDPSAKDRARRTKEGLEGLARRKAEEDIRLDLGRSTYDAEARRKVIGDAEENPDLYGGPDFAAKAKGEKPTDKKAAKKAAETAKGDAQREKQAAAQNTDLGRILSPGIDQRAEDALIRADGNPVEQAEVRNRLGRELEDKGMNPDDAAEAARDVTAHAREKLAGQDPRKAREHLEARDEERAREFIPDVSRRADAAAVRAGKDPMEQAKAEAEFQAELQRRGMSEEDADHAGTSVMNQARRRTGKQDQEEARDRLKSEAVAKAEKNTPGLKDVFEQSYAAATIGGMSATQFARHWREQLKRDGLTDMEASDATDKLTADTDKEIRHRAIRKMITGDHGEQGDNRKSEMFDTSSLTAKIQGSVGGQDEQKKHTTQLDMLIKLVAGIGFPRPTIN
jgi:hypothetical protein